MEFHKTSYGQSFAFSITDGNFGAIIRVGGYTTWHQGAIYHTINDANGYIIVFNFVNTHPVFYTQTFRRLCRGQRYEFSLYIANVSAFSANQELPNFRLEVRSTTNQTDLIARLNIVIFLGIILLHGLNTPSHLSHQRVQWIFFSLLKLQVDRERISLSMIFYFERVQTII